MTYENEWMLIDEVEAQADALQWEFVARNHKRWIYWWIVMAFAAGYLRLWPLVVVCWAACFYNGWHYGRCDYRAKRARVIEARAAAFRLDP